MGMRKVRYAGAHFWIPAFRRPVDSCRPGAGRAALGPSRTRAGSQRAGDDDKRGGDDDEWGRAENRRRQRTGESRKGRGQKERKWKEPKGQTKKPHHPKGRWGFEGNLATTYSTDERSVPSALRSLTSLFGMGRGVSFAL